MASRRALLRAGGAAALAALAGCLTSVPSADDTTDPTSAGAGVVRLDADPIAPAQVPDGATVGLATIDLHDLVAAAATADGRVDLRGYGNARREETLSLGAFEYVRFDGATYEATGSFAGFGEESTADFTLLAVDAEAAGDDADVTTYESLSEREQAVADDLLANGSIAVGPHERRPEGVGAIVANDFVRADGQTYRTQITVGDPPAHHMLTLDAADPGEDAQVVTVPDQPPEIGWSELLSDALEPGTVGVEDRTDGESLVEYLQGVDYVATVTSVLDVAATGTVQ
jgi:hypothetical protein